MNWNNRIIIIIDGYLEGGGYVVTWCVGHLVELASPQEYDEKYKKWSLDNLRSNC